MTDNDPPGSHKGQGRVFIEGLGTRGKTTGYVYKAHQIDTVGTKKDNYEFG